MIEIHVDGRRYEVEEGTNLLDACLSRGLDLPYFCWHPALGSVGACRQCAVKKFKDAEGEAAGRGQLVMACMTPSENGARLSIDDPEAKDFRASVTEWLMVNHPHDCPICDEGGECHLQDMTVMTGHTYREFRFNKRTFRNQDLGPLVNHEMNRCIQCYRCVRFYQHAGGSDLQAFASRDHVYFGRHEDGALESPFSGNLVEVCPTGVFTDKTLKKHYTRKWDLQTAPSVCAHCSLGCNTSPGERYGELRRVRNRYHSEVNGYFLCDRGRYGYEFVNHDSRIKSPLIPHGPDAPAEPLTRDQAWQRLSAALAEGKKIVGIGSPRASLESNWALRRRVGEKAFHSGASEIDRRLAARSLEIMRQGAIRTPTLREVESCDAVLVLGEDVWNTAPRLALALRQAARRRPRTAAAKLGIPSWNDAAVANVVQDATGPFFIATPAPCELDALATSVHRGAPETLARLGLDIAGGLENAREIADALAAAERPLVVSGAGARSEAVLEAAAAVARSLAARRGGVVDLVLVQPEADSLGLALLDGRPLEQALELAAAREVDTLVVIENDLYRRAPRELVDRALKGAREVVAIDHVAHETGARASLLLPAATFAEASGTLVNNEGRAQRFYRVLPPAEQVQESWRWLGWESLDALLQELAEETPQLAAVAIVAPPAGWRLHGQKIPRQTHRASGRTAMTADRSVREPLPPADPDSPLAFSMEGAPSQPPAAVLAGYWVPGWNSVQALNRFQEEIAGPLRGGPSGVRLIEPAHGEQVGEASTPPPFEPRPGEFRLVPLWHVFGSEELSRLAPGIAALAPASYLALGPEEAERLGASAEEDLELELDDGRRHRAPLRVVPGLPAGVLGVPVGLGGAGDAPLPERGVCRIAEESAG